MASKMKTQYFKPSKNENCSLLSNLKTFSTLRSIKTNTNLMPKGDAELSCLSLSMSEDSDSPNSCSKINRKPEIQKSPETLQRSASIDLEEEEAFLTIEEEKQRGEEGLQGLANKVRMLKVELGFVSSAPITQRSSTVVPVVQA